MVEKVEMWEIPQDEVSSVKSMKAVKAIPKVKEEIVDKYAPLVKPTFWVLQENHDWKHSISGVKNRVRIENGRTLGASRNYRMRI